MREALWLYLRNSGLGQRLRAEGRFARPLHGLACRFLPKVCRVRSGPCRGLLLEPSPSWPTALWEGTYESEVQRAVEARLGPGTVFYDVGGGIGIYSLLAARQGAQVYVFEPLAENARRIVSHARRNSLESSIVLCPEAVYSRCGRLALAFTQRGSQLAPRGHGGDRGGREREVPCVTLDEFSRTHRAPTLVKVDVEGGESEVLRGAGELFERVRPSLLCELHDAENARFVKEWLAARHYALTWLGPPGLERNLLAEPASSPAA